MSLVQFSYLELLPRVASHCGLSYASIIFEVAGDGSPLYGIELCLPPETTCDFGRIFFFWGVGQSFSVAAYEQAAFQAISFLQKRYGFIIEDYSFHRTVVYSKVGTAAVSIAAKALGIICGLTPQTQAEIFQFHGLMKQVRFLRIFV